MNTLAWRGHLMVTLLPAGRTGLVYARGTWTQNENHFGESLAPAYPSWVGSSCRTIGRFPFASSSASEQREIYSRHGRIAPLVCRIIHRLGRVPDLKNEATHLSQPWVCAASMPKPEPSLIPPRKPNRE